MAKLHELYYKLLPYPPYSQGLAPSDFFMFADFKRMLAGKKFSTNEQVIPETEVYFEAKEKSYYKNGIENCMIAIIVVSPSKATILMLRLEGFGNVGVCEKNVVCEFRAPLLLRPFTFLFCARNLNTPVVCGGFSMEHTSIKLSVCRGNL
jgi:hypothetical protein